MNILSTFRGVLGDNPLPGGLPYIVVLGPYHRIARANEGWISRVRAIDRVLCDFNRVYINFSIEGKLFLKGNRATFFSRDPWIVQYNLDHENREHMILFSKLMDSAEACYAHNLHLAEHALPWSESGKLFTDMHGAVPEEEAMLGYPDRVGKLEEVERKLIYSSSHMVVVSRSLENHLIKKYNCPKVDFIRIPICEPLPKRNLKRASEDDRWRLVYCGSAHRWQNIHDMLDLASKGNGMLDFEIYSHQFPLIKKEAKMMGFSDGLKFGVVNKDELPQIYSKADFGFVLRDDNIVNRVACPTKLYEYLHFGVIPIVRCPDLGDFVEYGYRYVREVDFKAPFDFCDDFMSNIIEDNFIVAKKLEKDFESGASELLKKIPPYAHHQYSCRH